MNEKEIRSGLIIDTIHYKRDKHHIHHLADIVESSDDAIISRSLAGIITVTIKSSTGKGCILKVVLSTNTYINKPALPKRVMLTKKRHCSLTNGRAIALFCCISTN